MSKTKTTIPTQTVHVSARQLKEFGHQLSDIMVRLKMTHLVMDELGVIQHTNPASFERFATKFLATALEQNQQIYNLLDDIAFCLLECDNAEELEAYAKSKMEG